MIKQFIKSLLGEKNTQRVIRLKSSVEAAKSAWRSFGNTQPEKSSLTTSLLISVHMLEKASVIGNVKYLGAVKYNDLINKISCLIEMGVPPEDFSIAESVAVIKSTLALLSGHEDAKSQLEALISKHNIPLNLKGGSEKIPSAEILKHINFDFHGFVSSRHSVRKFKDTIISREKIYDIVRDASYYPSACNRQPCKVYFSEDREKIADIIKLGADGFLAAGIHDCLIVTCDRALLSPRELDDQEYINGGIFLGYLVMSIHAHGLGACLFQCTRASIGKQDRIRRRFGISGSEVIVCCIGIGELEDEVSCACAQRRPVETVAVNLDS